MRRPLLGARVVVTRAQSAASALSAKLAGLGAEVIEMPVTRIEPLDPAPLAGAIARLNDYGWLVFTSQNAVAMFWAAVRDDARGVRALADRKVAAVGPATSEALAGLGIAVDVMPGRFVAEDLLAALGARDDVKGGRVLYLAARGARDVIPVGLRALGARVDVVALYESVPDAAGAAAMRERLLHGGVDVVTFTAASAARAFVGAVGADAAARARLVSIGPVTSDAVRAAGLKVSTEAESATIDGLVRAVVASQG